MQLASCKSSCPGTDIVGTGCEPSHPRPAPPLAWPCRRPSRRPWPPPPLRGPGRPAAAQSHPRGHSGRHRQSRPHQHQRSLQSAKKEKAVCQRAVGGILHTEPVPAAQLPSKHAPMVRFPQALFACSHKPPNSPPPSSLSSASLANPATASSSVKAAAVVCTERWEVAREPPCEGLPPGSCGGASGPA